MVNSKDFIKRLERLFEYYNFSAAAFADKISVQRSSISHLISGRNKPSLEFVLKVVKSFPEVNLYWLLFGKGDFPGIPNEEFTPIQENAHYPKKTSKIVTANTAIDKLIIFYTDGSFKVYHTELS